MKPILSRFCNLYISYPDIEGKKTNLHKYNKILIKDNEKQEKNVWLKTNLNKKSNLSNIIKANTFTLKLYEKGYSGLDLIEYIEKEETDENKYLYLIYLNKVKSEFRNEKLFILFILKIYFMRKNVNLENILSV